MTIGERIHQLRKSLNYTQEYVAKSVGVAIQTIHKYENNIVTNIPSDKLEKIAKVLNTSPAYLMGWTEDFDTETGYNVYRHDNIFPIETRKIPLIGEIACGEPICSYDEFDSYVEVGSDIRADFCLRCKGDSMINARINDGDIVFIREQPDVENGEIAAVVIEGDATLKRVYKKPNGILLMAENPDFDPIMLTPEEYPDVRIIGKAVAFQSDIK